MSYTVKDADVYDPKHEPECPKCQGEKFKFVYCNRAKKYKNCIYTKEGDHLHLICKKCKYEFLLRTIDSDIEDTEGGKSYYRAVICLDKDHQRITINGGNKESRDEIGSWLQHHQKVTYMGWEICF